MKVDLTKIRIGKDGRCKCDCATVCPRGNCGMAERCTADQLKEAGVKVFSYYEGIETFYVVVQSRREQLKCNEEGHEWRDRCYNERGAGWKHVCKKCGACAR